MITVRPYRAGDETGWLRCRVLAFLDTAYFDDVRREKERYKSPAVELAADTEGQIVGLMDVECARAQGMIWHLAVHPDFRRQGIATALLREVRRQDRAQHLSHLEAWTCDDPAAQNWYLSRGFRPVASYLHVFMDGGQEMKGALQSAVAGLMPVLAFAHYLGDEPEEIKGRFRRVHECRLYHLPL